MLVMKWYGIDMEMRLYLHILAIVFAYIKFKVKPVMADVLGDFTLDLVKSKKWLQKNCHYAC